MRTRLLRVFALACALSLVMGSVPWLALAQDGGQRYDNPAFGVAFNLPDGWQVAVDDNKLIAASPADIVAVQAGSPPRGLVLRIVIGSFNELGITDATELPALVAHLVPGDITPPPPEPAAWGNSSGYQLRLTMMQQGVTTRIGLLAVAGGRVAVVRGMAPPAVWDGGAGDQFDALVQSLVFSLPERDRDYLGTITSNDGGVFWHYQEPQPESGRVVVAGGITYDMFNVMYMTAGPGGVMALDMIIGRRISYIGPWYGGNFVDVAIGPDTKLFLANVADDTINAVMVVDRAGNYVRGWGTRGDGEGQFAPGMPRTITIVQGGDVWTVSEGHASGIPTRLYRFDNVGNLRQTVDLGAINPDLSDVRIAANRSTGALYVVGATGNLNVLDSHGQPLVLNLAQEILRDVTPFYITIAPDDNIILAVPAPGLDGFGLLELGVSGRLLDVFGYPFDRARGDAFLPGDYHAPAGLIVAPDGTLYWTETHPDTGYTQVQAFTFRGDGRLQLGVEMAEDGTSPEIMGVSDPSRGGGTLSYGQSVRGALNNRYPTHNWTFEGHVGDHVIITMIDASGVGDLDPMLSLKNAEGREIAANDDVGSLRPEGMAERDALIDFFLPVNGVYTIEAGRFGGRGDYILTLEKRDE